MNIPLAIKRGGKAIRGKVIETFQVAATVALHTAALSQDASVKKPLAGPGARVRRTEDMD